MNNKNSMIDFYKNKIEAAITQSIHTFGRKNRFRDSIEYALKNGGKRFRPIIVYLVASAIGKNQDATDAALAVEFFHTASLIADDLPCMDDDDFRRDSPSVHKHFDEATALLATYALIAAGYDRIRLNAQAQDCDKLCVLALENAAKNTGIHGATGGQYFDLFPQEGNLTEIIEKKTATLFEISFVFGWLFGGGDLSMLEDVKSAAYHFGMAFQMSDDLIDIQHDRDAVNTFTVMGKERASQMLLQEIEKLKNLLKKLRLNTPELLSLVDKIERRYETAAGAFS